jgi:hypothetical protein
LLEPVDRLAVLPVERRPAARLSKVTTMPLLGGDDELVAAVAVNELC